MSWWSCRNSPTAIPEPRVFITFCRPGSNARRTWGRRRDSRRSSDRIALVCWRFREHSGHGLDLVRRDVVIVGQQGQVVDRVTTLQPAIDTPRVPAWALVRLAVTFLAGIVPASLGRACDGISLRREQPHDAAAPECLTIGGSCRSDRTGSPGRFRNRGRPLPCSGRSLLLSRRRVLRRFPTPAFSLPACPARACCSRVPRFPNSNRSARRIFP